MSLFDRLKWLVCRRQNMRLIDSSAHLISYIDSTTVLAGNNKFGMGTQIRDSMIGRFTYVHNAKIAHAEIGAFCSIGPEVIIGGLGNHPTKWLSTHPAFYSTRNQSGKTFATRDLFEELKRCKIGNDVWIGARALILDGITIGDGAIIAAGSVVINDIPPYAIVGGVPAKLIRTRFDSAIIEALLKWQWWFLPDEELALLAPEFCKSDLSIERLEELQNFATDFELGKVEENLNKSLL